MVSIPALVAGGVGSKPTVSLFFRIFFTLYSEVLINFKEDLIMFGRERCEMTTKMRNGINEMFKEIVALDGLPIADFIGTDPKAMLVLGYATKILDYTFEMLDDAYGFMDQQKEINEKLLNELERVNKKLDYQETLIRDLKKTTKSKEDNKE